MIFAFAVSLVAHAMSPDAGRGPWLHGFAVPLRGAGRRAGFAAPDAGATRFSVVEHNGVSYLEGRDKKPFFSMGVCCVTTGESFLDYDAKNPSYAAYKYYPEGRGAWAQDTVDRLQSWGFNTIGAWSDAKNLMPAKAPNLRFTPILHMGSGAGAPWLDMWDPKVVDMMNAIARDQIKVLSKDPRVIGYFSDNEQGWWNGALFDWIWKGPNTRKRFVAQLQERYKTWAAMSQDFVPDKASSFAGLSKAGRLYLRPGGNGIQAVHAYIKMLAERYYSICRTAIKKYDPGSLYLGDRFISNFYPEVAEAAGEYADVVSTNLNADWNDGTFTPFYLPSLHRLAKKPLMITEYYFAAKQNRSGNKNDSSGFPVVETQAERARGFTTSTEIFLHTPYLVGAHWFQYTDEPQNGRGDGENYDMGLVDIDNEPYEELTQAARSLDQTDRSPWRLETSPTVPEIADSVVKNLEAWPRNEAYVRPTGEDDRGDAFLAWTPQAVYLALYWNDDRFGEGFYKSGKVPTEDEPIALIGGLKQPASIRFIDKGSKVTGPVELVSLKTGVRNTAIVRISASALGEASLTVGMKPALTIALTTASRGYRMQWSNSRKLSN